MSEGYDDNSGNINGNRDEIYGGNRKLAEIAYLHRTMRVRKF
jgi:hypothetical protein